MEEIVRLLEGGRVDGLSLNVQQRMAETYAAQDMETRTNCRGTALYVNGVVDEDCTLDTVETKHLLEDADARRVDEHAVGDFMAFRGTEKDLSHMGVVLEDVENPYVFHRDGFRGQVRIDPLHAIENTYHAETGEHPAENTYFLRINPL